MQTNSFGLSTIQFLQAITNISWIIFFFVCGVLVLTGIELILFPVAAVFWI